MSKVSDATRKKMSLAHKGRKFTEEHKRKIAESRMGEKHPLWKGARVGYKALHQWVRSRLGKADVCWNCGTRRFVEWANISHLYLRDLIDWRKLCKKCHRKHDAKMKGRINQLFRVTKSGYGSRK